MKTIEGIGVAVTPSVSQYYVEVSGHPHAPATLLPKSFLGLEADLDIEIMAVEFTCPCN
jgi:hypothetical protein